jgi:hypothetical protein
VQPLPQGEEDYTTHVVVNRNASSSPWPQQKKQKPMLVPILLGSGAAVAAALLFALGVGTSKFFSGIENNAVRVASRPTTEVQATPANSNAPVLRPNYPVNNNSPEPESDNTNVYAPPLSGNANRLYNANVYGPPVSGNVNISGNMNRPYNANVYRPATPQPHSERLIEETMTVDALHYRYIHFTVQPNNYQAVAVGRFDASGGSNDIEVLIIPASEMSNFQNHNQLIAPLKTGYITGRSFRVPLSPGDYYLIFNNQRSLMTRKIVRASVQLSYE